MNGDQRRTTDINIRRVIGTYDDFIMTALSLQTNSTVFIDKTQRERTFRHNKQHALCGEQRRSKASPLRNLFKPR